MKTTAKKLEFRFERTIQASPDEVYDAWLSPEVSGTPWNMAEKLILNHEVDGLFYWAVKDNNHYGRFTEVDRPRRIQHTWVSPHTLGDESIVTVTFQKNAESTLMTLIHSGLPDTEGGKGHERGWNYFLGIFPDQFGDDCGKSQ